MSLLNLSHNPSSTFLKSFLFRTYWFILLPQSREPGNKLHPFTQDIKTEINTHIPHLQTCHKCPIKKDLILKPAEALTELPCLPSTPIHLIHYNIIDFCVSQREWSIILYLCDIKRDYKGKSEAGWAGDMDGSLQTSLMNG